MDGSRSPNSIDRPPRPPFTPMNCISYCTHTWVEGNKYTYVYFAIWGAAVVFAVVRKMSVWNLQMAHCAKEERERERRWPHQKRSLARGSSNAICVLKTHTMRSV